MLKRSAYLAVGLPALLVIGCGGDDDDGPCDVITQDGCDDGMVCEEVEGAEDPECFDPVVMSGLVFDLADEDPIEGARVVALDVNGAAASAVAVTDVDGTYELTIPSRRDADGNPFGYDITLRADASGYQTFPDGLRQALPIDTSVAAQDGDDDWVIETVVADIGLLALEGDTGTGSIHGNIELPDTRASALVVAEVDGVGYSAIADRSGDYEIFNLPAGDYDVVAYARGFNYEPGGISLADGDDAEVDLDLAGETTATLSGSVQFADPGAGEATSVILVVKSTYDETFLRGATPPGLRAPDPGLAPDITEGDAAFSITGVPAGEYYVLAAFENDFFTRDIDPCISGTDLVSVTVGEDDLAVEASFKITGSLDITSPGADGPEAVSAHPTFLWDDDSSEEKYDVLVLDSFGETMWETRIDGVNGGDVELPYDGDPLESGMYYQLRVVSVRMAGEDPECRISRTEDLKGVFYVE